MPPVKDFFDATKRERILEDAIKKTKGKGEFTFAFGIGKSGSCLAIDFRNEHTPEKFLKEIKKTEFKDKFVVGKASINGKVIEMKSLHSKNKVKPIEVKDFLANVKGTVSQAKIDGKGDDDPTTRGAAGGKAEEASKQKEQAQMELKQAIKDIDKLLRALN